MQRSISRKEPVEISLYIILFIIYESLSSIYLFLPPMFAVLFLLFYRAIENEDGVGIFLISFCLIIFEAEKGYLLFSSIIYFSLLYKFIMPRIIQNFNCNSCIKASYVLFAYIGFYIFSILLSKIFLVPMPDIDYYIIYYIVIEFFILSIL